ncbi:MAG: hypothetical protein JHC70_18790 [Rhodococcus sp.]|nr:hypothetical protein [Rhodococcus sp. (in: high G+C Gram-positive bacteria)]
MTDVSEKAVERPILLANPDVPTRFGRVLALLALSCLVAHVPLIASHLTVAPVTAAVMAAVSLACIPCARRLWTVPSTQDCAVAGTLAAVMVGLHMFLALSMTGTNVHAGGLMPTTAHHKAGVGSIESGHVNLSLPNVHHMVMSPFAQVMFQVATAAAVLQILLSGLAIITAIRRVKASRNTVRRDCPEFS